MGRISIFRSVAVVGLAAVSVALTGLTGAGASSGATRRAGPYGPELGMNISIDHNDTVAELDAYAPSGAGWVRLNAFWNVIQAQDGLAQDSNWATTDAEVITAEQHGLRVLLMPSFSPPWAAPPGCSTAGHCLPANPHDYANFVALAAQRYSPGGTLGTHVTAWEVWNEENGSGVAGHANPRAYTNLLKLAFPAIRAVNPTADVIVGGLAATNGGNGKLSAATYLRRIYHDGGAGFFTAVADHPYPGTSAPLVAADNNAFARAPELHRIMAAQGDGTKLVWATEIGYSSSPHDYGVGLDGQATLLGEAITQWFKWKWTGPLFVYNLRDLTANDTGKFSTTGLLDADYSPKPAWNEFVTLAGGTPPARASS